MSYTPKHIYEYVAQAKNDPILERRICPISKTQFPIYKSDADVYQKASPTFAGKNFSIPFPTICPEERRRRRLATRNERRLYRRTCDFSGESIISTHSPNKPHKVYQSDIRRSDKRDSLQYGRDFDFSQNFFPQFHNLSKSVPRPALQLRQNENSPYVNCCGFTKDSYLSFNTDFSENCYYATNVLRSKYCFNTLNAEESERCYDSYDIKKSDKVFASRNIIESHAIYFSSNLTNCSFCFGCKNLVNKQYHVYNKPVSQEEFASIVQQYCNGSQASRYGALEKTKQFRDILAEKSLELENTEESYGQNLVNAKNCAFVYDGANLEDVAYSSVVNGTSSSRDFDVGGYDCELCIENISGWLNYHCLFSNRTRWGNSDCHYCDIVINCKNCFGCVWLRDKEYCVFNKQYDKESYEQQVAKIISHMMQTKERGEFFPIQDSTYGYNETIAQQYFPLSKDQAKEKNVLREEYEYHVNIPENATIIQGNLTEKAGEDVISKVILSTQSQKPFRIMKKEREFCNTHGIPLPQTHPDERFAQMRTSRPSQNLNLRNCSKTNQQMLSIYSQNTTFPVWSTEVFDQEVFG